MRNGSASRSTPMRRFPPGRALLFAAACGLFWACESGKRVAGGGSDIGNGGSIAGTALTSDGRAAVGVRVRLRPIAYLPALPEGVLKASSDRTGSVRADTLGEIRTDSRGRFSFADIRPGEYRVEILDSAASLGALIDCRVDSARESDLAETRMAATGEIRILPPAGSLPSAFGYVRLPGMERIARLTGGAELVIDRLPAGVYGIRTASRDTGLAAISANAVRVRSDSATMVDASVTRCGDWACDSLALMEFLKANAIDTTLGWFAQKGPRINDLAIAGLPDSKRLTSLQGLRRMSALRAFRLEGPYLTDTTVGDLMYALAGMDSLTYLSISWSKDMAFTTLPASIGGLTNLKELFLLGDSLRSLPPEIGNLRKLEFFSVQFNRITELPSTIGNLVSLRELLLSQNRLAALPPSLYSLPNLIKMDIFGNRLCALTEEDKAWLRAHDADPGPDGQTCP
jgi:hypothetical protein